MGGDVEVPDCVKQNNRNSVARPLTDIPTRLLKQSLDVPPRQAAAGWIRACVLSPNLFSMKPHDGPGEPHGETST